VAAGNEQDFKRPDGPERDDGGEIVILEDDALACCLLGFKVVAEQTVAGLGEVVVLRGSLGGGFVGDEIGGPDLAVGVLAPIMAPRFSKICTYWMKSWMPSS
jgi:hypothetical protein